MLRRRRQIEIGGQPEQGLANRGIAMPGAWGCASPAARTNREPRPPATLVRSPRPLQQIQSFGTETAQPCPRCPGLHKQEPLGRACRVAGTRCSGRVPVCYVRNWSAPTGPGSSVLPRPSSLTRRGFSDCHDSKLSRCPSRDRGRRLRRPQCRSDWRRQDRSPHQCVVQRLRPGRHIERNHRRRDQHPGQQLSS